MKLNKELYAYCVSGWNGGTTGTIQLSVSTGKSNEYKPYRIELQKLLPLFRGMNWKVIEPKGNRKYIYLEPAR